MQFDTLVFLVEEAGLFVFDAQFAVDGGEDALYLSEGEHTAEEGVASIVTVARLVEDSAGLIGKGHTVVNTHRQLWVFLLENPCQLNEVGTSAQVAGFSEVAVGEDMA